MPDSPDQSVHNSHMTLEDLSYANKTIADTNNQHLQRSAIQVTDKKNTTMPIMYINENNKREDEDLETQLEDMMEIIRSQQEGDINDIDEKLQQLLEYMNTKIRNNPQNPKILEFKMIFQFLTEYKKARDLKLPKKTAKPAVPKVKRYPKAKHSPPRPAQSAYYYSPKASETTTTVMNQG